MTIGEPSTDQEVLWVQLSITAGSSHTKDVENGSGPWLHGTHGVSIMKLDGLACGPMTCYPSEAAL